MEKMKGWLQKSKSDKDLISKLDMLEKSKLDMFEKSKLDMCEKSNLVILGRPKLGKFDKSKFRRVIICTADLEKQIEDIEIEFLLLSNTEELLSIKRELLAKPFTLLVFKELPPKAVSLYPFTKLLRDKSLSFSTVFLNSILYCVGGAVPADCVTGHFRTLTNYSEYKSVNRSELYCYDSYDDVDRFNLFRPIREARKFDRQWMSLPPMSIGRCRPFILSREGKIYVFGCRLTPLKDLHPFSEVYDPLTNEWTTLINSVPPPLFGLDKPAATNCVFVENQTKVLVILTEEDISFTWPLESSSIDPPPPYSCCPYVYSTDPIVVVNDIAFVFVNFQEFYAYRLKNGMFCGYDQSPEEPTLVKGFEPQFLFSPTYPLFFFHENDMHFYLVWEELNPANISELGFHTIISRLRFHIVKNGDSLEDLFVVVDGCWSYKKEGNNSLLSATMK